MVAATSKKLKQPQPPAQDDDDEPELILDNPEKTLKHLFLQSLMSRRVIPADLAKKIYEKAGALCGVDPLASFADFKDSLDEELAYFGLEMKSAVDESTGTSLVVLVNLVNNDTAKIATEYHPQEIAFYRVLINKIMTAPNLAYSISWSDAVRCTCDPSITPQITKQQSQVLIKSLAARGWLNLSSKKHLTLSARALTELAAYLRDHFQADEDEDEDPDDKVYGTCRYCSFLVTIGQACPKEGCGLRVHATSCIKHVIKNGVCPGDEGTDGCGERWEKTTSSQGVVSYSGLQIGIREDAEAVAEDYDSDEEEETPVVKKKAAPAKKATEGKTKSKKQADLDEEEEEAVDEEDEDDDIAELAAAMTQNGVDPGLQKRRSGRASTGKKVIVDDEDDEEMDE